MTGVQTCALPIYVRILNEQGEWTWIANPKELQQETERLKEMEQDYFKWEEELSHKKQIEALNAQIKAIQAELREDEKRLDQRIANIKTFMDAEKKLIEDQNSKTIKSMDDLAKALEGIDKSQYATRLTLLENFISRYNTALAQMQVPGATALPGTSGATGVKTVYGNSVDLANAQSILGSDGYRFVNTEALDTSKLNFGSDDIIVGGTASSGGVTGNIGDATRLSGATREATAKAIEEFQKQLTTFHTGGMATEFSKGDSGIAIVKRKELILDEMDTKNFLASANIFRNIMNGGITMPKFPTLHRQASNTPSGGDTVNIHVGEVKSNDSRSFIRNLRTLSKR